MLALIKLKLNIINNSDKLKSILINLQFIIFRRQLTKLVLHKNQKQIRPKINPCGRIRPDHPREEKAENPTAQTT